MKIGTLEIGAGHPCAVIAEIGNAHNQEYGRASRLLDAAKAAGASAAKLQCFDVDELIALRGDGPPPPPWNHLTMRQLYSRAMTPRDWFPSLFKHAARIGLPLFSSVFGAESLALLESLDCPAYKLARIDVESGTRGVPLIAATTATGKPILASVSKRVRGEITERGGWLWCPSGYPQEVADMKLPRFGGDYPGENYIGLSSHCLAPELPVAAVARGAQLIEMHFQLDAEPSELESSISLGETAFATMVRSVRTVERLLA